MSKYPYKTEPFDHQRVTLNKTALLSNWAWFLEQGCGKTKMGIDNFAFLFLEKKINGVVWVAPNGVHTNFVEQELPIHLPDCIPFEYVNWKSSKMGTIKAKVMLDNLLSTDKLAILSINFEATITKEGKRFLDLFLKKRTCFMNVDESSIIATPNAITTKRIWAMGKQSPFRRIMNGTPARDGSPLDYFGQMAFLDRGILGFPTFSSRLNHRGEIIRLGYKDFVAEWDEMFLPNREQPIRIIRKDKFGHPVYKNLDVIADRVAARSTRVLKNDVLICR